VTGGISALEALRNALYKFKTDWLTYLLTYLHFDIFQQIKISNKLYDTLMQYVMTISYQSLVVYVKTQS